MNKLRSRLSWSRIAATTLETLAWVGHLTPIEFDLLSKLAEHPGRLVTHRQLLHEVWGPGYEDETAYLRVHFAHVRSKIEPDPANPRYVITEPGIGYRLRVD